MLKHDVHSLNSHTGFMSLGLEC